MDQLFQTEVLRQHASVYYEQFAVYYGQLCRKLNPEIIFNLVFACAWIKFAWSFYLNYRQYRVYVRTDKVTPELEKIVDQETLTKSRLYSIDKARFNFLHAIYSQVLLSLLLVYQAYPYAWNLSRQILQHYGYHGDYELAQTLLLISLSTLFFAVLEQPWSLYRNFVIEERHGFNKYTLSFYLKDLLKKFIVEQAIMLPVTAIAYHIIRIGGDFFFIYLWAFCTLFVLFFLTVYPDFIAPLFDTFIPLPESDLKTNIEKLAASIKYPLARLFVVHGSKRSSHSNAYMYGMFNKKTVVLYDTLIDKSVMDLSGLFEKDGQKDGEKTEDKPDEKEVEGGTTDEILAVLGHEFGHWKLSHLPRRVVLNQAILFITIAIFSLLYQNKKVYAAFGFFDERPIIIGLSLIFEYIFEPITEITRFVSNYQSRKLEFEADQFGKKLGRGEDLKTALVKLHRTNLSFPVNDWLYSAVKNSHPPLLERLAAIGKCD